MSAPIDTQTSAYDAIVAHTMEGAPAPTFDRSTAPLVHVGEKSVVDADLDRAAEQPAREAQPQEQARGQDADVRQEEPAEQVETETEARFTRAEVLELLREIRGDRAEQVQERQPQQPQVDQPPAKLPAETALEAFYANVKDPTARAAMMQQFYGSYYKAGDENDGGKVALMEAQLNTNAKNARLEARLAAFEAGQQQQSRLAAQAAAQQRANELFQHHLGQFNDVSAEMRETLADMVVANQQRGMNLEKATAAAFERGKALGLRLKGVPGRPSNQERVIQGRDRANAVVRTPTGQAPRQTDQSKPQSINDILAATFGGGRR